MTEIQYLYLCPAYVVLCSALSVKNYICQTVQFVSFGGGGGATVTQGNSRPPICRAVGLTAVLWWILHVHPYLCSFPPVCVSDLVQGVPNVGQVSRLPTVLSWICTSGICE